MTGVIAAVAFIGWPNRCSPPAPSCRIDLGPVRRRSGPDAVLVEHDDHRVVLGEGEPPGDMGHPAAQLDVGVGPQVADLGALRAL
jgi:hypothetical protein